MWVLTMEKNLFLDGFREFVDTQVVAYATKWDIAGEIPENVIRDFCGTGCLSMLVPCDYGGLGSNMMSFGEANIVLGRGCSSLRSVLTVHSMVCSAIARWGKPTQKQRWLPHLASGESIGAFALSEPEAGSDISSIKLDAAEQDDGYLLNGVKTWITFGQRADLFLCFAQTKAGPAAFVVPRDSDGLTIVPIRSMTGTKASMLARLEFSDCLIPTDNLIGRPGFGLTTVAASALEIGRYSVACGSAAILQACSEGAFDHARTRRQFGVILLEHQLIAAKLSSMATNLQAAILLCHEAGRQMDSKSENSSQAIWMAKYFSSTRAFEAAGDYIQIMGAQGLDEQADAQRHLRDAKVTEIIEGSTQLQEISIANMFQNRPGVISHA